MRHADRVRVCRFSPFLRFLGDFWGFLGGLGIGACSWRVARGGLAR